MNEPRARTNRLRRSVRASPPARRARSPVDTSTHAPRLHDQQTSVQTQTPVRSRLTAGASAESPHNDSSSDLHQDIIWDTTSPSPLRLRKRGVQVAARAVNISDIVNRIAPESGRPRVLEPTLQQWIGDSATIPCTPDLQPPKAKKKSPRPNTVDDLLKLAKQLDFNMLHEDCTNGDLNQGLNQDWAQAVDLPVPQKSVKDPDLGWASDEDLDYLFDRSTQSVSGAFSQSLQTPNMPRTREKSHRAQTSVSSKEQTRNKENLPSFSNVHFKQCSPKRKDNPSSESRKMDIFTTNHSSDHCSSKLGQKPGLSQSANISSKTVGSLRPAPDCGFDDDWGDNALMDDSLLMEMTQNPLQFTSPKCTSTQQNVKRADKTRRTFTLTANSNFYTNLKVGQEEGSEQDFSEDPKESDVSLKLMNQFSKDWRTQKSEVSKPLQERLHSVDSRGTSSKSLSYSNPQRNKDSGQPEDFSSSHDFPKIYSAAQQSHCVTEKTSASVSKLHHSSLSSSAVDSKRFSPAAKDKGNDCFSNDFGARSWQSHGSTGSHTGLDIKMEQNESPLNSFRTRSPRARTKDGKMTQNAGIVNFCDGSQVFRAHLSHSGGVTVFPTNGQVSDFEGNPGGPCVTSVLYRDMSFVNIREDFPEEDLDSIFSSEPLWDDDMDDDLLCELCEVFETQIQGQNTTSRAPRAGQGTNQTQRAGQGTNQTQRAGQGTNQTQRAGQGTNQTQRAGQGTNQTQRAGQGTNQAQKAGQGTNQTQKVGQWSNQTQMTGQGTNQTQRAGQGTNQTQGVGQGTNQTQRAGQGTNQEQRTGQGTNQTQRTGQWSNQTQRTGQGTNQTQRAGQWSDQTQRVETNQQWSKNKVNPQKFVAQCSAGDDFTFKRPDPVSPAGPQAGFRCSTAEIELKKQRALERRRQRLQAAGASER